MDEIEAVLWEMSAEQFEAFWRWIMSEGEA